MRPGSGGIKIISKKTKRKKRKIQKKMFYPALIIMPGDVESVRSRPSQRMTRGSEDKEVYNAWMSME